MATFQPAGSTRPGTTAQWLIVVFLAVIAVLLAGQLLPPAPPAAAQTGQVPPAGPSGGVFAVAGQVTRDTYGLYLVDTRSGTICLYQYLDSERVLQLRACRTFAFDVKLESYNTKPDPAEIKRLGAEAASSKDVTTRP